MPLVLNWLEIEKAAQLVDQELSGQHVDQWIVPERPRYPGGFVKGEWLLRTGGRKSEGLFLFSVRPRHPYFAFHAGKGPKAAQTGTRSPFDLAVAKHVKGRRIHSFVALRRERVVVLWMENGSGEKLGLVLSLIPATPEAFLVEGDPAASSWKILARSRANTEAQESALGSFTAPDGSKAPDSPAVREELLRGSEALWNAIEADLDAEAFQARLTRVQRELKALAQHAKERLEQSAEAVSRGEAEPDWQLQGDLLKAVLHDPPTCDSEGVRALPDYMRDGVIVRVKCDPRLSPGEQVAKFYSLAKRRSRRISEGLARKTQFAEMLARFEKELAQLPSYPNWEQLERLERVAGIETVIPASAGAAGKREGKRAGWMGRTFRSREGLPILVGKTNAENLELTFKVARGNDLWMHVRGRPGAHVVVPLPQGKSAALETLLDAAVLAIFFSGGQNWGKTEVDYTFKKHVKRIKDSTEASYTHNKTLIVEPEPARLKRLLETDER